MRRTAANGKNAAPSHVMPIPQTGVYPLTTSTENVEKKDSTVSARPSAMTIHSRSVYSPSPACGSTLRSSPPETDDA